MRPYRINFTPTLTGNQTMASLISSLFQRDPKHQFPYDLTRKSIATISNVDIAPSCKKAEPEEKATLFSAEQATEAGRTLKLQIQKLKTMRHPGILTYLESTELDGTVYLITEPCLPLNLYIEENSFTEEQLLFGTCWGIYQVLNTLKFLHEANVSHERLSDSIYVTPAGDWKLANLDKTAAFSTANTDLRQLGFVVWQIFNGFREFPHKPPPPGKIPTRLQDFYKRVASPTASRLNAAELIFGGGLCKNRFVDTLLFLEEFQLKEAHEKQAFFANLRDHLGIFPDGVSKYKILPKLLLSYEFGDAGPSILIPLFKLSHLLDEQEYQRKIVPCLVKLFSSPDRATRVKLLESIDEFATHLTPQIVNEKIFSNLATGFSDTSPAVRESTVKAMVSLAEKLNVHNLNNELMKHLARLQGTDEQGGIRTNTTICLGKIGCFLEPANRQKILIGAFTRGMKDPFPPARIAAVLALSATQQFYSLVEVANRIVPALGPLTCDPEKQVRDQAFKALKGFLDNLEKASENPEIIPELEAQVKAGGKGIFGSDKVPQWASWALKSLSGKIYKGTLPSETVVKKEGEVAGKKDDALPHRQNPVSSAPEAPAAPYPNYFPTTSGSAESQGWDVSADDDIVADDDDWGLGFDVEPKPAAPIPAAVKGLKPKPAGGGLKLNAKVQPKTSKNDDLDVLLGISDEKKGSVNSDDGWGLTDDYAKQDPGTKSDDWGGWDSAVPSQPAVNSTGKSREERRAELAARNEARKKELAAKKAQRTSGITKAAAPAKKDSDAWEDF
ncbi:unnamed protein product, partial [Mesorhabditis spiculigera]